MSDIEIESYESMTKEDLIACCHAHDAHHKENHQWQEALKAENKMLVEALQMMVDKYGGMYDDYQEADIAAKEALAQRIGVK